MVDIIQQLFALDINMCMEMKLAYPVIHNNIKQKIQAFLNEFPIHVKVTFLAKLNFVPVFVHAVNKQ